MTKAFFAGAWRTRIGQIRSGIILADFGQRDYQGSILQFNAHPVGIGHLSSGSLPD
jgi:hypothetical protein